MLEIGQVISLKIRFNNDGTVSRKKHPYLVVSVDEAFNMVEVAQLDSLEGKEYKAAMRSNKTIYCDNPKEKVIDKDSYIQLDNKFQIEICSELENCRRQDSKLSHTKLQETLKAYNTYHQTKQIEENKIVYMDADEIKKLNDL